VDVSNLGLCLVCSLVKLHGGRTWFESGSGKGSSFYATFPIDNVALLQGDGVVSL
jgi:signal transduction histidine kinase